MKFFTRWLPRIRLVCGVEKKTVVKTVTNFAVFHFHVLSGVTRARNIIYSRTELTFFLWKTDFRSRRILISECLAGRVKKNCSGQRLWQKTHLPQLFLEGWQIYPLCSAPKKQTRRAFSCVRNRGPRLSKNTFSVRMDQFNICT